MTKNPDLLIATWHQVYLSSNAGGYIRLKEFLKRFPKGISYILLDNAPSIYYSFKTKSNIVEYDSPHFLKSLMKRTFILWFLLESVLSGCVLYKKCSNFIKNKSVSVVYFPIAELLHLYVVAILLKLRYPHVKIIVDILNYGNADTSVSFYKKLRKSGTGKIRSTVTVVAYKMQDMLIKNTSFLLDYIFTVSPELVIKIKKMYKKNTIDYTPSGVNQVKRLPKIAKEFLGVYVGRITTEKGVFETLKAWKLVVEKKPDACLALAGHVSAEVKQQIRKVIKQYGMEKNVTLFGQVSDKQKFSILAKSEIFLHLAKFEPLFPVIGILEGLSFGLPVVIYDMDVVSSQKELKNKQFIFIVRNADIKMAAEKILAYEKLGKDIKQQLSKEAFQYAKLFDWDTIAKKEFKVILNFVK